MVLDKITIEADRTSIEVCGGQTNVCVTGHFHLVTKSENEESNGSSITDDTIQVTWSGDADSKDPSTCTIISFDENKIGGTDSITIDPSPQPSREKKTTATYTYKGINLISDNNNDTTKISNEVKVTQAENKLQSWYYNTTLDRNLTISVSCPQSVSEYGGYATANASITYEYCEERKDQCDHIVGRKWTSKTVTLDPQTVTFDEQDCEEPARSQTVSFSYTLPNGLSVSDSCTIWQDASTVPCYPGENCSDAGCSGRIHWLCAEKKTYENIDGSYEVRGLDENGHLSCDGGTTSVRIASSNDKEYWTKSAYCSIETLPTVFGNSTSQDNVGLVFSHSGTTGRLEYTDSSLTDTYTYAAKYSAYTRNHITLHNNNETKETYCTTSNKLETIPGTSFKYEANTVNDWYQYSQKYYSRSSYVNAGGEGDDWDAAYDIYLNSRYCANGHYVCSVTNEEVSSSSSTCVSTDENGNTITGTVSWVCDSYAYDETLNPNSTGMTLLHKTYTVKTGTAPADIDMDYVGGACCVRNISSDYDYFWSAITSSNSIIKTFDYPQNTGIEPKSGSVTFTFDNTSPKPGSPNSVTVNYTVAACTTDTDKYTMGAVSGPTSAVECDAVPSNGVTISVAGKKSIIKVSVADPSISGETNIEDVTLVKDTDYTLTYTPSGINDGTDDRTITVNITGIGNYSGQSASFSYTQKADAEKCFSGTSCDPSTTITYSAYSISYNGGAVACDKTATPTVTATKITTTRDAFCRTSSTTQANVSITDFTVSYNPSGNNNGTTNRTIIGTVTHDGDSIGTFTYTQNSGATCYASTDVTGSTTDYEMSVTCSDIGKCDTTASPVVKGRSRTGVTHTTGETTWDEWGDWYTLDSTNYSLSYSPTLAANDTTSAKTYTVTATGLGIYDGESTSVTFTQAAGPCIIEKVKNCASVEISIDGRDWTLTLEHEATSNLTYKFNAINCYEYNGVKGDNWTQEITINKGEISGTARTNTTQWATSDSTFNSVSPSEDDTYIYSGCSFSINGGMTPCENTNEWASIEIKDAVMKMCDTFPTYKVVANGTHTNADCTTSSTSTTLSSSDYTATYSVSGVNNNSENRTVSINVRGKGSYSGLTTTLDVIQEAGPCSGSTTDPCECEEPITVNVIATLITGEHIYNDVDKTYDIPITCEINTDHIIECGTAEVTIYFNVTDNGYSAHVTGTIEEGDNSFVKVVNYTVTSTSAPNTSCLKSIGTGHTITFSSDCYEQGTFNITNSSECTPSCYADYDYTNAILSFEAADMKKCESATTISNVTIENVAYTSSTCEESTITENVPNSSYEVTYNPSGVNNTTSERTVKVTLTTSSLYGGLSKTIEVKQEKGKCVEDPTCTAKNVWTAITVSGTDMAKCDETSTLTVKANGTHTNSDCTTSTTSTTLSSSDYTATYDPSGVNNSSDSREVTIKVTGKGSYSGLTASTTVTQSEGPCSCTEKTNWTAITVSGTDMAKCDETSSLTVKAKGVKTKTNCETENVTSNTLTEGTDYTVTYDPSGANNSSDSREVTIKVTGKGSYASLTASTTVTQSEGPCSCTEKTDWSSLLVTANTMEMCDTTSSLTVKAKGVKTKTNCETENVTSSTLTEGTDYTVTYDPSGTNDTSSNRTVTVKVSGKGSYAGLTKSENVTQNAGPCKYCEMLIARVVDDVPGTYGESVSETYLADDSDTHNLKVSIRSRYYTSETEFERVSFKMSSNVDWIVVNSEEITYKVNDNTTTSERYGTITFKQDGDNSCYLECYIYVTQHGAVYYEFKDNDTPDDNLTNGYNGSSSSVHVISTKNSDMFSSITATSDCAWVTINDIFASGSGDDGYYVIPYSVTENTDTTERTCTITATQGESGKKVQWTITQEGKVETCNCSTLNLSLSSNEITINSTTQTQDITVTVTSDSEKCVKTWKAYGIDSNNMETYLTSGNTGDSFKYASTYEYPKVRFKSIDCNDIYKDLNVKFSKVESITVTNYMGDSINATLGSDSQNLNNSNKYTWSVPTSHATLYITNSYNNLNGGTQYINISIIGENIEYYETFGDGSIVLKNVQNYGGSCSMDVVCNNNSGMNGLICFHNNRTTLEISLNAMNL